MSEATPVVNGSFSQDQATSDVSGTPFFSVENLTKRFGALVALNDLSFDLRRNEIFGIAGPNGAGKSTLLNVCSGVLPPTSGRIYFRSESVEGLAPYKMCHKGVGRTFQIPQVFSSMSIEENIEIGMTFGHVSAKSPRHLVDELLETSGLASHRNEPAGKVDLITRKMTMLASVLATQPEIVFMDEPLAGLNSEEIQTFVELISQLHDRTDVTFVVVEHKIRALSELSDRLMVIHFGGCICLDSPEVVVKDEHVIEVYLGTEFDA